MALQPSQVLTYSNKCCIQQYKRWSVQPEKICVFLEGYYGELDLNTEPFKSGTNIHPENLHVCKQLFNNNSGSTQVVFLKCDHTHKL